MPEYSEYHRTLGLTSLYAYCVVHAGFDSNRVFSPI